MRTLAILLALAASALGGVVRVTVQAEDAKGRRVPARGARVAVVPADDIVDPERVLPESGVVADDEGKAVVPRSGDEVTVLAGMALRGTTSARLSAGEEEVTLVLPPEVVLSGVVRDPDGRPAVGAEVLVTAERPEDTGAFLAPGAVVTRTFTEATGRFVVYRLRPETKYRVRADAPGLAPATLRDVTPGAKRVELRLSVGGTVRGKVIAVPGGAAVAGVPVTLGALKVRTAEDGTFEFRGVPPGAARLAVRSAGHLHVEKQSVVVADGETREDIVVRVLGTGRLRGSVLTPATLPAAGAELLLRYPPDPGLADRLPPDRIVFAGRADEAGKFDLDGLLPAQGVDLIARHPDYAPTAYLGYSVVPGRTFDTILLLRRGGVVEGRVLGPDGTGRAGVKVVVFDDHREPGDVLRGGETNDPSAVAGRTGEGGAFRIERVPSGRRAVVALTEGTLPAVVRGVVVSEGRARTGVVLTVGAAAAIRGVVSGEGDEPVGGAEITAEPPVGEPFTTTSDPTGAFAFTGVPAGRYRLRIAATGFAARVVEDVKAPAEGMVVLLERGSGLSGRVLVGETDQPASAVVTVLLRGEPSSLDPDRPAYRVLRELRTDGRFTVEDLERGVYRLEAWTEDRKFGFVDGVRVGDEGRAGPIDIRVLGGWELRGRVVDERNGRPVEGADVAVLGAASKPGPLHAATAVSGDFHIPGVPPGFHTLLVRADGFAPKVLRSVELRYATDATLPDIPLSEGSVVRGSVTGPGGLLRSGVTVRLESAAPPDVRTTRTDEGGFFRFEHVAPGAYLLVTEESVPGESAERHERLVTVNPDEELVVAIGTGRGSTLTGRVLFQREPVAHALVTVLRVSEDLEGRRQVLTVRADAEGNYVANDLEPGDLLVTVHPPDGGAAPVRFAALLPPGPVTVLDLELPDSGVEGTVQDVDTGEPVAGATLVLVRSGKARGRGFLGSLVREIGEVRSGADGGYRFPSVPPGVYRVEAVHEGYGRASVEGVRVTAGGYTRAPVALPRAGRLAGRVIDDEGRPVTNARVTFLDRAGEVATRAPWIDVDSEGRFETHRLATGTYTVIASAPGLSRARQENVDVFPGGSPEVLLRLKPEGRLVVTVYGPGGTVLEGARLSVKDFWGRSVALPEAPVGLLAPYDDPAVSDRKGEVTIPNLAPGIYTVSARLEGYAGPEVRMLVRDGELTRGAVVLLPVK